MRHPKIKGHPTIVVQSRDKASSQKIVFDFSPELASLREGQPGMPLQQALSQCGDVELIQADIPYYWLLFNEILDRLEERSPLVEGSDLGCAYIGLDGLQLLYRSGEALIDAIREVIPETFEVRIGMAEGKFLAYLAARYGGTQYRDRLKNTLHTVSFDGNIEAFLKDLSCDVLPVSTRSRSKLHNFGIHTLGQIRNLPPGPIQSQFGPEGKRILELARGYDCTPLYPRSTAETIEESTVLSSVTVSLESLLAMVESLLSRIFTRYMKGRGIRSLILWTRTWDGTQWERSLHFKEPAMDISSTISRVKQVIENYPQPGPVEQLGIRITRIGYGNGRQGSLFSEVRAKDHLMEDIKQLDLRLGDHQVFKVKEVEPWSRIPERRYTLTPLG